MLLKCAQFALFQICLYHLTAYICFKLTFKIISHYFINIKNSDSNVQKHGYTTDYSMFMTGDILRMCNYLQIYTLCLFVTTAHILLAQQLCTSI